MLLKQLYPSSLFKEVFSFTNLYKSYRQCIRNVRWKESVQKYIINDIELLTELHNELLSGKYKSGHYHYFNIIERGKLRHIASVIIKERIVQKCLCDNYLTSEIEKRMIYNSGATRKGKGTLFQIKRFKKDIHNFYLSNNRSNQGYILLGDLHNYFGSIDRTVLLDKIKRFCNDEYMFEFIKKLIYDDKQNIGLQLGNQISQGFALYYLSDLDHYIKEQLHAKYYGRYMDDFYIISDNKEYLENCLSKITKLITEEFHLKLNTDKTKIAKLSSQFNFLKMKCHLKNNGKLICKVTNKSFHRHKVTRDYIESRFTQHKRYEKYLNRNSSK